MSNRRKLRQSPVDRAMLRDRRYFKDNPTAREYVRPAIAGEVPTEDTAGLFVRVEQLEPGVRIRFFFKPDARAA
jgi:hypothetical protein